MVNFNPFKAQQSFSGGLQGPQQQRQEFGASQAVSANAQGVQRPQTYGVQPTSGVQGAKAAGAQFQGDDLTRFQADRAKFKHNLEAPRAKEGQGQRINLSV